MKEKISITLSSEVLAKVNRLAGSARSRSAFIEQILRDHLSGRVHRVAQARDFQRINAAADRLNAEANEVLGFQR
jgi:metal-responsive CopG/Arc/MetJ family transcriptional regulator